MSYYRHIYHETVLFVPYISYRPLVLSSDILCFLPPSPSLPPPPPPLHRFSDGKERGKEWNWVEWVSMPPFAFLPPSFPHINTSTTRSSAPPCPSLQLPVITIFSRYITSSPTTADRRWINGAGVNVGAVGRWDEVEITRWKGARRRYFSVEERGIQKRANEINYWIDVV